MSEELFGEGRALVYTVYCARTGFVKLDDETKQLLIFETEDAARRASYRFMDAAVGQMYLMPKRD